MPEVEDEKARHFASDLAAEFSGLGKTFLATRQECADLTAEPLAAIEDAHEYVLYVAERGNASWSRLCLGQADMILVVVRGTDSVSSIKPLDAGIGSDIPVGLALLWQDGIVPGRTVRWLDCLGASAHFHVRSRADVGRAARLLTGNGLGLVLSGGGARGYIRPRRSPLQL